MCFPVIYEPEEGLAERQMPEEEVVRRYLEAEEEDRVYQADHGQCSCHRQPADSHGQLPPPPLYQHIR